MVEGVLTWCPPVLDPGEHGGGGCTDLVSSVLDPGECGGGCTDLGSLVSDPGECVGRGCTDLGEHDVRTG